MQTSLFTPFQSAQPAQTSSSFGFGNFCQTQAGPSKVLADLHTLKKKKKKKKCDFCFAAMASKSLLLRRISSSLLKPRSASLSSSSSVHRSCLSSLFLLEPSRPSEFSANTYASTSFDSSRTFSSFPDDLQLPAAIDYSSQLQEEEYHRLADSTIHDLQEKFEEYGDCVQVDGFDIDYGNQVLTLKLGSLGTYVLNKQTPNRQLWLSSPVSGPARFDWDSSAQAWVYRRNKANLLKVFESELEQLCGVPITLS